MSKTNDTPSLDHGTLADSELAAVTAGRISTIHPAKVELGSLKS